MGSEDVWRLWKMINTFLLQRETHFGCRAALSAICISSELIKTYKGGTFTVVCLLTVRGAHKPPHLWVWVRNKLRWLDFLFCRFFSFHVNWLINQHLCLFEVEYVVLFWCAYDANFVSHQLCKWLNPAALYNFNCLNLPFLTTSTFRERRSLIALILQRQ